MRHPILLPIGVRRDESSHAGLVGAIEQLRLPIPVSYDCASTRAEHASHFTRKHIRRREALEKVVRVDEIERAISERQLGIQSSAPVLDPHILAGGTRGLDGGSGCVHTDETHIRSGQP
jgi:hypothetical protein